MIGGRQLFGKKSLVGSTLSQFLGEVKWMRITIKTTILLEMNRSMKLWFSSV